MQSGFAFFVDISSKVKNMFSGTFVDISTNMQRYICMFDDVSAKVPMSTLQVYQSSSCKQQTSQLQLNSSFAVLLTNSMCRYYLICTCFAYLVAACLVGELLSEIAVWRLNAHMHTHK